MPKRFGDFTRPEKKMEKNMNENSETILADPATIAAAKRKAEFDKRRSEELVFVRTLGKIGWENACRACGCEILSGPRLCKHCAFRHEFPQLAALLDGKVEEKIERGIEALALEIEKGEE